MVDYYLLLHPAEHSNPLSLKAKQDKRENYFFSLSLFFFFFFLFPFLLLCFWPLLLLCSPGTDIALAWIRLGASTCDKPQNRWVGSTDATRRRVAMEQTDGISSTAACLNIFVLPRDLIISLRSLVGCASGGVFSFVLVFTGRAGLPVHPTHPSHVASSYHFPYLDEAMSWGIFIFSDIICGWSLG